MAKAVEQGGRAIFASVDEGPTSMSICFKVTAYLEVEDEAAVFEAARAVLQPEDHADIVTLDDAVLHALISNMIPGTFTFSQRIERYEDNGEHRLANVVERLEAEALDV